MKTLLRTLLICLLAPAAVTWGQDRPSAPAPPSPDNVLSTHNKFVYRGMKAVLLSAAERMPEANYSFKPTDAVRSFGGIVGHLADSQYLFCSAVLGEKNPRPKIEETRSAKADLIAALKDACAYCDRAYDGMTDASATAMVKIMGGDTPKLSALSINNMHNAGHYGNIVTYLRLKNIVPPTSEPAFMQQIMK